jgi:hypothetical protein
MNLPHMKSVDHDVIEQGRAAKREGRPLDSNPWFGGGKTEAANQLKWELGWKQEHARIGNCADKFVDKQEAEAC